MHVYRDISKFPLLSHIFSIDFPPSTQAAEGARWMAEKADELAKVEAKLASLSKRVGVEARDGDGSSG